MSPEDRERMENIRNQIIELKRKQKEEQEQSRRALQEQIREVMQKQKEAEHARNAELDRQIREILQESREEDTARKQSLRDKLAQNVMKAREEHVQKYRANDAGRWEFFLEQGDTDVRKGFLKFHILVVLKEGPSHGYEIMHSIGHHTGGMWRPSPGSLYPALDALESRGYIACQGDGRRKIYSLTPKGEEAMAQIQKKHQEQFLEMKAFLSDILGE